jgi:hypothetical protein
MNIYYTGVGCNKSGVHTEQQFLDIMNRTVTFHNWSEFAKFIKPEENIQLQFKDWVLPDDFSFFSLADWLEYSGAEMRD